jgi:gas vesicle protein
LKEVKEGIDEMKEEITQRNDRLRKEIKQLEGNVRFIIRF